MKAQEDRVELKTYCSPKGMVVKLRPVSQFKLDLLRTSLEEVPVPTYVMNVVGEDITYPLDEISAGNKGRLDEWKAYLLKKKKQEGINTRKFTDLLFYEGVDVDVPGVESEWQKSSDRFGIKLSDDPVDRKLQYIYSEILVGGEDVASLTSQIFAISQVDEAVVAKMRDSFRARKERGTAGPTEENQGEVEKQEPDL